MTRKQIIPLFAVLIILLLVSCQPQIETEPRQQELPATATASPGTATPLATLIDTPILETITLSPTSELLEEVPVPEENPTMTPDPESGSAAPDQANREPTSQPAYPSGVQSFIDQAVADLSTRQTVDSTAIELLSFEDKVWPDSSLGCPQPGMNYLQVLSEGYLIRLRIDDQIYNYHGGGRRGPFLCEQPELPVKITKPAPLELNPKQTPTKSVPPPRD